VAQEDPLPLWEAPWIRDAPKEKLLNEHCHRAPHHAVDTSRQEVAWHNLCHLIYGQEGLQTEGDKGIGQENLRLMSHMLAAQHPSLRLLRKWSWEYKKLIQTSKISRMAVGLDVILVNV